MWIAAEYEVVVELLMMTSLSC